MKEGIIGAGIKGWLGVGETKRGGMRGKHFKQNKGTNRERLGGRRGYVKFRDNGLI